MAWVPTKGIDCWSTMGITNTCVGLAVSSPHLFDLPHGHLLNRLLLNDDANFALGQSYCSLQIWILVSGLPVLARYRSSDANVGLAHSLPRQKFPFGCNRLSLGI